MFDIRKHHRRSIRLAQYDYGKEGSYFVTICAHNREHLFGEIRHGIMGLSEIGCIVANEIQRTNIIRPYVRIDTWIVMPNHAHLLIDVRATRRVAPTVAPTLQPRSLGSIIGQLKSIITKQIYESHGFEGRIWQRNYFERIVRTPDERVRIKGYILNNPSHWSTDELSP